MIQRCIKILFPFLLFSVYSGFSQISGEGTAEPAPVRVEIPAKTTDETHQVIPCGKRGVMLFFKGAGVAGDTLSKWYFSWYDQNLNQVWVKNIQLGSTMMISRTFFADDTLSLLFVNHGKEKKGKVSFRIIRHPLRAMDFISNSGFLPEDAEDIDFSVARQTAFIFFNQKNGSAQVQVLELSTGMANNYPWSIGTTSRLTGFSIDTNNMRIRASLAQASLSKSRLVNYLVSMDINGKILAEIPIQPSITNRYLRGLDFINIAGNDWLVFGSYGTTPVKTTGKIKKVVESSGFFTCKLKQGQPQEINYINLLELQNSKALLGDRDVMALKKKALKKNRNLSEYSLDYPLMMHKVFRHKDQFILVAETFTPQYHSESFTDFDFYGRPYVNTYDVFDGYRYNNAILTAYDSEGRLLWDNTLEIRNLITYELTPKITVFFTPDDEAVLTYLSEGKIASKIIKEANVIEKLDFSPLELAHPGDKLLAETRNGMVSWYDNFFLCYGYQEIKNISSGENNKRLVFYFTKIAYN